MRKFEHAAWLILATGLWFPSEIQGQSNTTVVVGFWTTNTTPLNSGFAGFCTEMLSSAVEYSDTNFQQTTSTLSPGWLRYPGGGLDDAFAWTNGLYNVQTSTNLSAWATQGKVSSTQTNFSFTDVKAGMSRFYRLVVP
jgi:hypothetical protein